MFRKFIIKLNSLFGISAKKDKHSDSGARHRSVFEELPAELKQQVACFLSTRDLLNLAKTSKSISLDLNLSYVSSPLTDEAPQHKNFRLGVSPQCFGFVMPNQTSVKDIHSITFTCQVTEKRDSYLHVWVVEQDPRLYQQCRDILPMLMPGKVVTPFETRRRKKVSLSFPVQQGKFYLLYISKYQHGVLTSQFFSKMTLHQIAFSKKTRFTANEVDVFTQPVIWSSYGGRS